MLLCRSSRTSSGWAAVAAHVARCEPSRLPLRTTAALLPHTFPPPPSPQEMEPPVLSTLLHAAGTQTAKTSQFSRRHCLALAAQACTPQGCIHWRAMLEPPLLGKLLGLLGRALRDGDAAVCAAVAEGLGTVAAQLAAARPGTDLTCEPTRSGDRGGSALLGPSVHACEMESVLRSPSRCRPLPSHHLVLHSRHPLQPAAGLHPGGAGGAGSGRAGKHSLLYLLLN